MRDEFVSEAIEPIADSFAPPRRAGEPAMPMRFIWRGDEYEVTEVLDEWKESSAKYGEEEVYLRKHWYEVRTSSGTCMKIYFERQARSSGARKQRWWLYTMTVPGSEHSGAKGG